MEKIVNNRQVNVWRGTAEPPTIHHLWIRDESTVLIYDDDEKKWVPLNEFPGITFESDTETGTIVITSGKSSFRLAVEGLSLGIHTNVADTITITSNALNTIDTEAPLYWDKEAKKLTHNRSSVITEEDVKSVTYGPTSDIINSDSFSVPEITVDKYGHVQKGTTHSITVSSTVAQNVLGVDVTGVFPLILAPSPAVKTDIEAVYKTPILQIQAEQGVQAIEYTLVSPSILVNGNQTISGDFYVDGKIYGDIVGDVQGSATPIKHASIDDTYGLGTAAGNGVEAFYGHVKLQDTFEKDSSGSIVAPESTEGVAASPLLIYNALQEVAQIEDNQGNINKLKAPFTFSNDFQESNEKIHINWLEV